MSLAQSALPPMSVAPQGFDIVRDMPEGFAAFYRPLHERFSPRRDELDAERKAVLARSHEGALPGYLPPSDATTSDWKIELPPWCLDQRNQMTGPADEADLVVKMLNSGAPGVMLDLEDSMANDWDSMKLGMRQHRRGALRRADLRGQEARWHGRHQAVVNRRVDARSRLASAASRRLSRGTDLRVTVRSGAARLSSGLFARSKHPLAIYIPKSEVGRRRPLVARRLPRDRRVQGRPTMRSSAWRSCEAHPFAFQLEEFAYNLREHLLGLNLGRWDYMASLIHFNIEDPDWVLPDRNTIPHDVALLPEPAHVDPFDLPQARHARDRRHDGALPQPRRCRTQCARAAVLEQDKKNEATCLMDGAWTGHPDQNDIAVAQFPVPNQLAIVQSRDSKRIRTCGRRSPASARRTAKERAPRCAR